MVRGLARFREHFARYNGQYVLIGGSACDLLMTEAGLSFRATKDLDIVLCVEAIDAEFVRAFWRFVRLGGYHAQVGADGQNRYYRFSKPQGDDFPFMLELFSRRPGLLDPIEDMHLTPIPVGEGVSSLSAILLDESYYVFLHSGQRIVEGVSVVGPEHLIPLKARAWLDLTERRAAGEPIDSRDISKHKNDVFRIYSLLDPTVDVNVPNKIRADLATFLDAVRSEPVDLRSLGIRYLDLNSVIGNLRERYRIAAGVG